MTIFKTSFDGGTDGAGMTTGNTGGVSGDAFTAVEPALTFSNEWAQTGPLSAKLPAGGVTGYGRWAIPAGSRDYAMRGYARVTGVQTSDTIFGRVDVGGANTAQILLNPDSKLRLRVGPVNIWTAEAVFPVDAAIRYEWLLEIGTTADDGRARVAYYMGDSLTPVEDSGWLTGLSMNGDSGTLTNTRVGKSSAAAIVGGMWLDTIEVRTGTDYEGLIGPFMPPSHAVVGAVVSASVVVGVVTAKRPVTGKLRSASTVTGNLTQRFTGRVESSTLVSGRMTAQRPVVGVVATASTITGHMEPVGGLTGTITAVTSVTGKVTAARPVTGTSSTASTVTGRLDAAGGLTGRVTAATSVTGSVTARLMVGGTARSSSTVTGRLTARHAIYGAVLTVSAVTGETIPGGLPPIPNMRILQGARMTRILAGSSNTRPLIGHAPTRRLEGTS